METHCKNPDKCPANIERERDMSELKQDYEKTTKALKETDGKLNKAVTASAVTNTKLDGLIQEIRRDRADNQRLNGMFFEEFKTVHKRITDGRVEFVKQIGDAKLASAQATGEIKAGQGETKGLLRNKIDWPEIIKLAILISTILGIFKYVLPNT